MSDVCLNYISTALFYQSDSLIRISDVFITSVILMKFCNAQNVIFLADSLFGLTILAAFSDGRNFFSTDKILAANPAIG